MGIKDQKQRDREQRGAVPLGVSTRSLKEIRRVLLLLGFCCFGVSCFVWGLFVLFCSMFGGFGVWGLFLISLSKCISRECGQHGLSLYYSQAKTQRSYSQG